MEKKRDQSNSYASESPFSIRRPRTALGLVAGAHFFSHFYLLVLPPLFLAIQTTMTISFTQLGFIMTLYALGSASGQYPVGIWSDKYGPRWFLIFGMTLVSVCFVLMGFVVSYWQLLLLALLAGFGDSVFHPTDFAIITAHVGEKHLGRAYAIHAFTGFLGFAAAPVIVDTLRVNWGWQLAVTTVGLVGLAMALALFVGRGQLVTESKPAPVDARSVSTQPANAIAFLKSGPILMLFGFYVVIALAGSGIQQFSISALPVLYDVDVSEASRALFAYMVGIAIGVLAGGIVADRVGRLDVIATFGYLVASTLMLCVAFAWFPFIFVIAAFFLAGFMMGAVFPSRDLMVRAVSPKGSAGKAFGFVNSGFGYGGMIGPLIYGTIMDTGFFQGIYFTSAIIMMLAIATAIGAGILARSRTAT